MSELNKEQMLHLLREQMESYRTRLEELAALLQKAESSGDVQLPQFNDKKKRAVGSAEIKKCKDCKCGKDDCGD